MIKDYIVNQVKGNNSNRVYRLPMSVKYVNHKRYNQKSKQESLRRNKKWGNSIQSQLFT